MADNAQMVMAGLWAKSKSPTSARRNVVRVEEQSNQLIIHLAQPERSDRKASAEN